MQPEILAAAPRCGARTRAGSSCRSPAIHGRARCRMHGGKGSGAPRGNRNAWKHGLKSARIREIARYLRATSPAAIRRMVDAAISPHAAPPHTAHSEEPPSLSKHVLSACKAVEGRRLTGKTQKTPIDPMHPGNRRRNAPADGAASRAGVIDFREIMARPERFERPTLRFVVWENVIAADIRPCPIM